MACPKESRDASSSSGEDSDGPEKEAPLSPRSVYNAYFKDKDYDRLLEFSLSFSKEEMQQLSQSETFQQDFAESSTDTDMEWLIESHKHRQRMKESEVKLKEARKALEEAEKQERAACEELKKAAAAVAHLQEELEQVCAAEVRARQGSTWPPKP